jgi:hypothetical protein
MEYIFEEWTIGKLLTIFLDSKLNLNPPYQRNDIWPLANKKRLIDSVKNGYPLPMFFLHKKDDSYDMVDGQQRTRTLIGYTKDLFPDVSRIKYSNSDKDKFNQFKIGVTIIYNENNEKILQDFYYRVNKFGTKLNRPEILKAQYFDSIFQNLVEKISYFEQFQLLNLFTDSSLKRMNDFDFIAELLALIKYGNTEKKTYADKLYSDVSFNEEESINLENAFKIILNKIVIINNIFPISTTRYSQKNDFYTLWGFILKYPEIKEDTLIYFYKILVIIEKDIKPTNEKCFAIQEYATNCVSQSNSKRARDERLLFLKELLLNESQHPLTNEGNNTLKDIMEYYGINEEQLLCLEGKYYDLNIEVLNTKIETPIIF